MKLFSSVRLLCALGFVVSVGFLLNAATSDAAFKFKETFGSAAQPSFETPAALAVDSAGDLLVVDLEAKTVSRFKSDGTADEFSALGTNVIDGLAGGADETPQKGLSFGSNPSPRDFQIAVDNSGGPTDGDIYVTQREASLVDIFDEDGSYLGQLTASSEGPFGLTVGVTVDPAGAVYVSEFNISSSKGAIHKFVNGINTANFPRPSFGRLAAGIGPTAGFIFDTEFGKTVAKLDSATGAQQYIVTPEESVAVAVNPANGHIFNAHFVNSTESQVKEFDASGPSEAKLLSSFSPGGSISGIAVDGATGDVYVARESNPNIEVWEAVKVPEATTEAASEVGVTTATLNGSVNPNGLPLTECFFEYDTTKYTKGGAAHGEIAPCENPDAAEVGEGTSPVEVHAKVSGLATGTNYHFRLVTANVNNSPGEPSRGEDEGFLTIGPAITAEAATQITATEARIGALIDPKGEATSFLVKYVTEAQFKASGYAEATSVTSPTIIPAEVSGSGDLATATGTGDLAKGFSQVQHVHATSGEFAVGQSVSGPGIFAGTTIVAFDEGKETLTLSQTAEASGTGVALSAGSPLVTNLATSAGQFTAGQQISGPGIPAETTILSVGAGQLTLSKPPTETAKGTPLTASGPQAVSLQLSGLSPDTTYHFRLVATNGAASGEGEDWSFATFASIGGGGLPDGRAYELASPPQKAGEVIPPEPTSSLGGSCADCLPGINDQTMPMQSAPDGESVLYYGQPFSGGLAARPNEYLAGRGGSEWQSQSLSPPNITGRYEAFSEDLSQGVLYQVTPTLAPEAPSRGGVGFANLYLRTKDGSFSPLVTVEPPNRDSGSSGGNQFEILYAGANAGSGLDPAFSHLLFEANDALTEAVPGIAPAAPEAKAGRVCTFEEASCDLYEWSGGALRLINVLPGNSEAAARATIGSGRLLIVGNPDFQAPNVDQAISNDGSRIFWSSEESGQVYVRINGEETLQIPGPGTCEESTPLKERACFLTASADGSKVLISSGKIYELNEAEDEYEESADLSEGEGGFEGILGASEVLSRVYFIDSEVLTGSEENANEESAEEGKPNLYAWDEGELGFIGVLRGDDNTFRYGAWKAEPPDRTAQVSPDGRLLAFMSQAPLTGYDNAVSGGGKCNHSEGAPCFEVFEYAAESETLACASCNPSGQRPLGPSNLSLLRPSAPFPQPGNLSRDSEGRLFFESQDALSPRDTNGHIQDVYEWEPNGVGGCKRAGGCVSLISSGHSTNDSMFLDSTPSGDDAFFITREQLVTADHNEQLDLYDARVGGGLSADTETLRPECQGEACQPAAVVPSDPTPSSSAFQGAGNVNEKPKRKHHKRKHKRHAKKHHHKRAAGANRGGAK
jgi:hypothetical protein